MYKSAVIVLCEPLGNALFHNRDLKLRAAFMAIIESKDNQIQDLKLQRDNLQARLDYFIGFTNQVAEEVEQPTSFQPLTHKNLSIAGARKLLERADRIKARDQENGRSS